ncbi:unnamed protein product [Soboliphyme baturini]|uniref:Uncharacterized protein n=1 Tax=Soboliphyme baturini TaxID=241478 RepID=A0A183IPY7_9BILA|nr:unnamed protein product [Soboliphyme baturini]
MTRTQIFPVFLCLLFVLDLCQTKSLDGFFSDQITHHRNRRSCGCHRGGGYNNYGGRGMMGGYGASGGGRMGGLGMSGMGGGSMGGMNMG